MKEGFLNVIFVLERGSERYQKEGYFHVVYLPYVLDPFGT